MVLAVLLATIGALAVTLAAPASAWMRDVTAPTDSFAVILEPYESDAAAADWYAAQRLCDNEIVPAAHELGFTWLKPYYCSDKLHECAPFATGSGRYLEVRFQPGEVSPTTYCMLTGTLQ